MTCRRMCGVCGLIRYIKVGSEQRSGEAKLIKIQDAHSWMVGCTGICSAGLQIIYSQKEILLIHND